jgi:hypothetical protein
MEDAILRLVRRRAVLQERLSQAEDAIAYSRVLVDIACLNRQLAAVSGKPSHHSLGFLRPIDESPDG